jgi:uncharacterized repeat protein (TIGR01451 family)
MGIPFNVTVTARDVANNPATGYTGTVHFTSTDGTAVLPSDSTLTNGTGTFSVTLNSAGNHTVTATDTVSAGITGTSGTIAVASLHFAVSAPPAALPGSSFNFTVTALDVSNNVVTGYAGTVHFTSSDGLAVLPADSTLTNGTGTFSATLNTPGSRTITATDTVTPGINGTSSPITVPALHFVVSAPATTTAGSAFNVTVTALDASNSTVTGYSGTVHFTSTDGAAVLPADSTLTNGTGTFSVTLKTAGNRTITAKDTVDPTITGTSSPVAVSPGPTTNLAIATPSSATAGVLINVTVTARDVFNNTTPAYAGTIHFTSTDVNATLPADTTLTNGTGTFSATLKTAGGRRITATDTVTPALTVQSGNINVTAGPFATYGMNISSPFPQNVSAAVAAFARDAFNNLIIGYSGTASVTTSDANATVPATVNLNAGFVVFNVTMRTLGGQTITLTDVATPKTGTSNVFTVTPLPANHFGLTTPATAATGAPFNFTVQALAFNDTPTILYDRIIHFTSTDPSAVLPPDSTLTDGVGTFQATLNTVGAHTITATDTIASLMTNTSNPINVSLAPATHFAFTVLPPATAGSAFNFTITALDQFNNPAPGYTGTVHFTSSDGSATLPIDATLTNGTGTFSATFRSAGPQTITATDTVTGTIIGTSSPATVMAAAATHLSVTAAAAVTQGAPFNFTVTALDTFNNPDTGYAGTLHFTSSDGAAVLPANSTLTNGTGTFSATLNTAGAQTITATDTVNAGITGTTAPATVSFATLDLTMTQTVSASPYLTGMPVTYTIVVNNLGGVAATLVTVTDPLPAGMTFTTATPTLGTCVAGPPVTCSLGTIVSGGSASITLVAQLPATPGLIANTATVASSNPDSNPANDFASTQIAVVLASSIPTMSPLMLLMLALGVTLVAAMRLRF